MAKKLVQGKGVNDYEGNIKGNDCELKCYNIWRGVLRRCYSEKFYKTNPTYKGCSVCEDWLLYSNFRKWFSDNYRWDLDKMGIKLELDKDLLVEGNKMYSPETCVFLPRLVNSFLSINYKNNISGVTGVSWDKNSRKWKSQISKGDGHNTYLGLFNNIEDAKVSYKLARHNRALEVQEYMRKLNYIESVVEKIR